jgi:DNA invertase Pin-like site-specific DNA recombinase
MEIIGYVRCSTGFQATEGVTLAAQEEKIRAYAVMNGCTVSGIYTDAGISGKKTGNRAALADAINQACKRKCALVVYSLSRLARSTKDAITLSERLDKSGADLVSLTEKIDTTSASGKMVFRLLAVLAEFERDLVSERTSTALQHKKAQGERVGGIPFGYQDNGGKIEPLEREQSTITLILSLRNQGLTLRGIQAALAAQGIGNRNGSHWRLNTLSEIIKRAA